MRAPPRWPALRRLGVAFPLAAPASCCDRCGYQWRTFGISPFGLQAEINFALTDGLEVVFVRDATFVSKLGRPSEGELQGPILPRK